MNQDAIFEVWEWDKNSSHDFLATGKLNILAGLGHEGKEFALQVFRKSQRILVMLTKCLDSSLYNSQSKTLPLLMCLITRRFSDFKAIFLIMGSIGRFELSQLKS